MTTQPPSPYEVFHRRTPLQLLTGAGWRRLPALRVDAAGVLLGGVPVRHTAHTAFVPWQDLTGVVLWRLPTAGYSPVDHIGVSRHPGAPSLPGPNAHLTPEKSQALAPHVAHEVVVTSHPIVLWRLDPERLLAAVNAFAPGIEVRTCP
ncbi:hypothetical protein ACQYWQ_00215 [Streptomyces sp. P6-2-1]|uniref:hypothetical protein n=1 Tax=unclassified Streptomyces TaxID=2593676 RepID=UPI003D366674